MRYMGWDYPALLACPEGYLSVLIELANEATLRRHVEYRALGR